MAGRNVAAVGCLMMRLISRCAKLSVVYQELNASSVNGVVYAPFYVCRRSRCRYWLG